MYQTKAYTTKTAFLRYFRAEVLPEIRQQYELNGRVDRPARREAWHYLIDCMREDGALPRRAETWVCPW